MNLKKCECCGKEKRCLNVGVLGMFTFIDRWVCETCLRAEKIMNKLEDEERIKKENKEYSDWIKKRDKLLKKYK